MLMNSITRNICQLLRFDPVHYLSLRYRRSVKYLFCNLESDSLMPNRHEMTRRAYKSKKHVILRASSALLRHIQYEANVSEIIDMFLSCVNLRALNCLFTSSGV